MHHGDIQPANVFVMADKSLKVADVCFINGESSGFQRKYHDMEYTTPLSPQAMSGLMLGPNSCSFDKEKNDVWAIGTWLVVSLDLRSKSFNFLKIPLQFSNFKKTPYNFQNLKGKIEKSLKTSKN